MTAKEQLKNNVLVKMRNHVDGQTMDILAAVLSSELAAVEVVEMETLPATVDDSNEYIWNLYMVKKGSKLSQKSVSRYKGILRKLVEFCHKSLLDITGMDIELYLASIRKDNSDVSLDGQRKCISAVFSWMRRAHLIIENPCDAIEPYKIVEKPIDHMEPEEVEQLKSGCKNKRDRALIEFLRSTAVRVGEAEQVKVCDIDWRTGEVSIYGEKSRRYRTAFLDSVAIKYMTDWINARGIAFNSKEALFTAIRGDKHKGINRQSIRSSVYAIKKRAQMERRVYPHLFRKTTATNITKRGGSVHDAGEYIGHKDNSTAARFYAYVGKDHTEEIFKKYVAII